MAKHATTLLLTVDTINISAYASAVRVTNRGGTPLYVSVDGSTPGVGGDDCGIVDAGKEKQFAIADPLNVVVKVVSSVATAYSVESGALGVNGG